jgi:predicted nucleic acid-binding protein
VILVLDSSALITLARIGRLHILTHLAERVYIPDAVYQEIVVRGHGRPGSAAVREAEWIVRHHVTDRAAVDRMSAQLGRGEAEAIVLAQELNADALILDDSTARKTATGLGQRFIGLLGLLVFAKERRVIETIRPLMDDLLAAGFFVGLPLYHAVLRAAGEEPPE